MTDDSATTAARGNSRTGVLAAVVGGLLLLALVLVVTQRDPVELPPDSPEATVQAFLQSWIDGDVDTSLLADHCPPPRAESGSNRRWRVAVADTTVDGDTATVELSVTEQSGAAVLDDGYRHDETYRLGRSPEGWQITAYTWPWGDCPSASLFPEEG